MVLILIILSISTINLIFLVKFNTILSIYYNELSPYLNKTKSIINIVFDYSKNIVYFNTGLTIYRFFYKEEINNIKFTDEKIIYNIDFNNDDNEFIYNIKLSKNNNYLILSDYFNNTIASNEKVYQVHITPENSPNIEELFFRLKRILNLTDTKIFYLKRKIAKQKPWEPIIVSDNLTWSEFSRLNLFLHELQGVEPVVSVARLYPEKSSAHIVGYVSEVNPKELREKKYLKEMLK